MEYRDLGGSGIQVSAVCLGTWAIGADGWGAVDDDESIAAIRAALDVGMTFIDTADIYGKGHSEEIVGRALQGRRHEAIIATKVANRWDASGRVWADCSYGYIMDEVQASLRRLRTDYIDLYLIHRRDPKTPIPETMRALEKLWRDGVVRAVGVSRYSRAEIEEAHQCLPLHAAQYPLNMIRRTEITPILPFCREQDIAMMAYEPLSKGLLTGKFSADTTFPPDDNRSRSAVFRGEAFRQRLEAVEQLKPIAAKYGKTLAQLAINWNLCQGGVTTALTGAKRASQVKENADGAGWRINPVDLESIEEIVAEIQDVE